MANEDAHFTKGPGRLFGKLVDPAKRGADDEFLVPRMVGCLRQQIRKRGGPAGLAALAEQVGVGMDAGRLVMTCSPAELENALEQHRRQGMLNGRAPIAASEAEMVEREWVRLQLEGVTPRSLRGLYEDWCCAHTNALFLSRIEGKLPSGDPLARVNRVLGLERQLRERLGGADADLIASIIQDATGGKVQVRLPRPKTTTAELMNVPIPVIQPEADLEGHNGDESADVSLQLRHHL
jgi:hypothetical protein